MSVRVQHIRGTTAEVESVTPLAGELGYDTTRKEAHLGDGATAGGIRLGKKNIVEIVAPAQITSDQNNYSPTDLKHAGALNINSDAARNITGLVPLTVADTTDGRTLQIYNTGSFNITLKNQSASSSAANRFDFNGADAVLTPKTSVIVRYSNSASRWIMVGSTLGGAVADGAVTARALAASAMGFSMINGTLVESRAAGAATFAIKTLGGGDPSAIDPVYVLFRNAALATGDYSVLTLTAAVSLVVSSGSSLGTTNNAPFRLWLVGFNDAGTFRLGVVNALAGSSAVPILAPDAVASSTAEGGAGNADSTLTFYTGAGVTSKPYAVLGYADYPSGLAAAGTWSAAPTTLQLYHSAVPLPGFGPVAAARGIACGMINGTLVESRGGNAATFAIKTLAGNDPSASDPVYFVFRNATAGNGDYTVRAVTAALALTLSNGSTLGASNNVAFRLWIVAFDTGSAVALGAINCLSGVNIYPLGRAGAMIVTSVAEGGAGAADSPQVFYTASVQTSRPYLIVGYASYDSGLSTAGAWASAPSNLQLFGPGVPLPGTEIQVARSETGAMATGTTQIPLDDTVPQNTEGDQYMSVTITPTSPCNPLKVTSKAVAGISVAASIIAAMFRDSTASAIAATQNYSTNTAALQLSMETVLLAQSAAATTFKTRIGPPGAATITFNGSGGARQLGAVSNSYMEARELMA